MASRKDNKGRVLHTGEYQRKDGSYQYSYYDLRGVRRYIYANDLQTLRKKERDFTVASFQGADAYGTSVTLNTMYDRYMATKQGLRESTYCSYVQMYDRYVREELGEQLVNSIRYSDVIAFYAHLLRVRKIGIRTIEYVHGQIRPALTLAVRDGYIIKNPTDEALENFRKNNNLRARKKRALTAEEQKIFLEYMKDHPTWGRYYSIFKVMLGTGLRVGELIGLRWEDVDFEKREISVNHSIVSVKAIKGGKKEHLKVNEPKTEAGIRTVPIMEPVMEGFKYEYLYSEVRNFPNCTIDGYTDFIFTKQNGNVYTSMRLDQALKDIVRSYNKQEETIAKIEKRDPFLLPKISNHTLRHTFCTRLCEKDMNIKVIQSVMGHASIKITMDIYAEVSLQKQKEEIDRLAKEIDVF